MGFQERLHGMTFGLKIHWSQLCKNPVMFFYWGMDIWLRLLVLGLLLQPLEVLLTQQIIGVLWLILWFSQSAWALLWVDKYAFLEAFEYEKISAFIKGWRWRSLCLLIWAIQAVCTITLLPWMIVMGLGVDQAFFLIVLWSAVSYVYIILAYWVRVMTLVSTMGVVWSQLLIFPMVLPSFLWIESWFYAMANGYSINLYVWAVSGWILLMMGIVPKMIDHVEKIAYLSLRIEA